MSRSFGGSLFTTSPPSRRALGDRLEPGHHPQGARLAAAARSDEDDELPVADLESSSETARVPSP